MFSGSCWTFLQRDGYFSVIYESFIANIAFFWGHNFQYREYRSFRFTLSTLISIVMINETDICRWYRGVLNYSKSFLFRLFRKEQQPPPLPAANATQPPPRLMSFSLPAAIFENWKSVYCLYTHTWWKCLELK